MVSLHGSGACWRRYEHGRAVSRTTAVLCGPYGEALGTGWDLSTRRTRTGSATPLDEKTNPFTLTNGVIIGTLKALAKDIDSLLVSMRGNSANVRFAEACKVADHFFGKPRQSGSSHCVWKMPWSGDPRVNTQNDHGKAKRYQVEQLLAAIDRLVVQREIAKGKRG